ncbi:DmsE family decaheme c-type cytochrome [Noviherbaspirillum sp. UKPF54]|uniref:DmsE family decaheme c-type cytochrome n=1 Tax=Noviherbaspirillum sp. UKPF54 TaxID=2601898 RepID=UPI0011B13F4D|nr:DmsE family decaheme c-type cytochrome [Noviherbaspirillum sp. UKPF54]QDZ27700.1 DmsE family decaheme c-type cytochrome [Noviherbaspirillum sp. UKPF54]
MKLWQKLVTLVAFTIGMAGTAPGYAADAAKPEGAKEAPKDLVLKGDAKCTACHDEADSPQLLAIGKTRHGTRADERTPTCTKCHGESNSHADYKGKDKPPKPDVTFTKDSKNPAPQRNDACLTCHQGGKHINWQSSTHANRDVACSSCHTVHNGQDKVRDKKAQAEVCYACHKEQRAQMNRPTHHPVPEGKLACTSCHDVHNDNPKALIKSSTNDTCYTCHMEKRGPFVHNHQPVTEDCGICHQPHGTSIPNLLKQRAPFLCQQCHSNTLHPANIAFQPNANSAPSPGASVVGRACNNCHTNIHGSNSTQSGVGNHGAAGHFRR